MYNVAIKYSALWFLFFMDFPRKKKVSAVAFLNCRELGSVGKCWMWEMLGKVVEDSTQDVR